jgi:hypothetical protein
MIATKICIEIKTGRLENTYRGNQELTNKHPELYEWIDYRLNGEPQELPDDLDTARNQDGNSLYFWDSENKELVKK